ncbi:MAG TPA: hypothetical protein VMF14_05480 [Solirubrobacteraceae bacterium]|nr:hypothetical protein [Solirubrobacteraceae bacterium]
MSTPASELLDGSAAARRAAAQILAEHRFHQPNVPRPLHGLLSAIGNVVDAPLKAIQSLVDKLGTILPGGVTGAWALLAAVVVLGAVAAAMRLARRDLAATAVPRAPGRVSAGELETLAAAAQDAGRLDEAVRLRFRAGLTRLSDGETVVSAPTRPTVEIARALGSSRFDSLARRFDEIAYGSSPATADDVDRQRREWPQILRAGRAPDPARGEP